MQYRITSADLEIGQITVTYFNESGDIATYAIDVHIQPNGAYVTGEALNLEIMARAPTWLVARKEAAATATGFAAIQAAVVNSTPFITLEQKKDLRKKQIDAYRDKIIASGVQYMSYQFDSDQESLTRLTSLVTSLNAGNNLPANFVWRSTTNTHVTMNESQVTGLLHAMTEKINATFNTAWTKKQAILNASTIAAVDAVTWADSSAGGAA